MHSHLGVDSAPELSGASDTNSLKGLSIVIKELDWRQYYCPQVRSYRGFAAWMHLTHMTMRTVFQSPEE
jgi:hypothetical protein